MTPHTSLRREIDSALAAGVIHARSSARNPALALARAWSQAVAR